MPAPLIFDLTLSDLEAVQTLGANLPTAPASSGRVVRQFPWKPNHFTSLSKELRQRLAENFAQAAAGRSLDLPVSFSHLTRSQCCNPATAKPPKRRFGRWSKYRGRIDALRPAAHAVHPTQAGCAMGCVFCATGQMGFRRHLTSGEIVEQVLYHARQLASQGEQVTNIVIMGMGEPFHKYEATMAAIDRLNHPQGFNFRERRLPSPPWGWCR
jgi:23S rRNA (adenine2503-C2)-methyltransferase